MTSWWRTKQVPLSVSVSSDCCIELSDSASSPIVAQQVSSANASARCDCERCMASAWGQR